MKRRLIPVIVVVVVLAGLGSWYSRARLDRPEKVSIGFTVADTTVLLMVAEDRGLFAANGLDATLKTYDTALGALSGMKKGEVDIAENAEFPIVSEAFHKTSLSILAAVDRFNIVNLVGRKDRGVQNIADLRGKSIGVPKGAVAEFYLGRFLDLNAVSSKDVKIVNLPFQQAVDALPGGSTDAFQVRFRDIATVKAKLGDNAIIWPCQNGQMGIDVLSAQKSWIDVHATTIVKVLKALSQAETYVVNHPAEAMAIVQKRLKYDEAQIAELAAIHSYGLSIDQSLVTAMEDEARWMIANNLTTEKQVPNFNGYISEDALKAVKPEAVNIIR